MSRELKQTLTMALIFGFLAAGGIVIAIGHYAKNHPQFSATKTPINMPAWMSDPNAPFVDLSDCINGKGEPENSHNVLIGKKILNVESPGICIVAIGDNVRIPPHASYYFNIGNHICGDLRTGQRLRCPHAHDAEMVDQATGAKDLLITTYGHNDSPAVQKKLLEQQKEAPPLSEDGTHIHGYDQFPTSEK